MLLFEPSSTLFSNSVTPVPGLWVKPQRREKSASYQHMCKGNRQGVIGSKQKIAFNFDSVFLGRKSARYSRRNLGYASPWSILFMKASLTFRGWSILQNGRHKT